jgi:hypothetical protein
MKKILIALVAMVMTVFTNNAANAMTEAEVESYILDTVPGATESEARMCADSWAHGGHFYMKSFDITLECEKHSLVKDWDLSKN